MKLIDRYEFTNGKAFETRYLSRDDTQRLQLPDCDVIGFYYGDGDDGHLRVMRPDEALIQARMLIDAVRRVTEGYSVSSSAINLKDPPSVEVDGEVAVHEV